MVNYQQIILIVWIWIEEFHYWFCSMTEEIILNEFTFFVQNIPLLDHGNKFIQCN